MLVELVAVNSLLEFVVICEQQAFRAAKPLFNLLFDNFL